MEVDFVNLEQIAVNSANPRMITDEAFQKLIRSILVLPKMLEIRPIVLNAQMVALGGNMRYRALSAIESMSEREIAQRLSSSSDFNKKTDFEKNELIKYWGKWKDNPQVPILMAEGMTDAEQREFIVKDNLEFGKWDMDSLANQFDLEELQGWGLEKVDVGIFDDVDLGGGEEEEEENLQSGGLAERFGAPPFSVLDTRQGYWQKRKRVWVDWLGAMGESREDSLYTSTGMKYPSLYAKYNKVRRKVNCSFTEYIEKYVSKEELDELNKKAFSTGVSLYDPVLAELLCEWFSPSKGSKIFDCFAGDVRKGMVFGRLGYEFCGIELRREQVEENVRCLENKDVPVRYICDDGVNVRKHFSDSSQDLLFSCPPYYDIEVYSDNVQDASNQPTYAEFLVILRKAFTDAVKCLRENRFAVITVGDVRDNKTGAYYGFCDDVTKIFTDAGMHFMNEIIVLNVVGAAAVRAGKAFKYRKMVKVHQNVLVFYKGDPRKISEHFEMIDISNNWEGTEID